MLIILTIVLVIIIMYIHKKRSNIYKLDINYYTKLAKELNGEYCEDPINNIKISNIKICKKIFSKNLGIPVDLGLGNLFKNFLGNCLGNCDIKNPAWSEIKKIFKPLFEIKDTKVMENVIDEWADHIKILYDESAKLNKPVTIDEIADDLPTNYILKLIFGDEFVIKHQNTFQHLHKNAEIIMWNVFNNKISKYFEDKEMNIILQDFKKNWNYIIEEANNTINDKIYSTIYNNYIQSKNVTFDMFSETL